MRFLQIAMVLGVLSTSGIAFAQAKGDKIVMTTPEEMKWMDVPGTQVKASMVSGDFAKGAYAGFFRLPAGDVHPLHTHSADVKSVVLSGTFSITPEGGTEKRLGPGSYFMVTRNVKHLSACAPGADCVLYQTQTAKFDMKPVAEKAAAGAPAAGEKKPMGIAPDKKPAAEPAKPAAAPKK